MNYSQAMRQRLITTANMCMARFNTTDDDLFAHLAGTIVVLGGIAYDELAPDIWDLRVYDEMILGKREAPAAPRFANTYCSQCGREFGPGEHGYSSCASHAGKPGLPAN